MTPEAVLHRRQFLKTFAFVSASSSFLGRNWTDLWAAEVSPAAVSTVGILRLNLANFPALQSESGSVRLGINPIIGNQRPDGTFFPVIVNRGPNNTFFALNSRCTHSACIVETFDGSQINCFCHGSAYAIDGRRISGPASGALAKYAVAFDGKDTLDITIPNLGFSLTTTAVAATGNATPRLKLEFRAQRNVAYEVQFRDSLDKPAGPVPFALTPEAPVDQNIFAATTTTTVPLYVERSGVAGFFSVAIRPTEV